MTKHLINNSGGRKPLPEDEKYGTPIPVRYTMKQRKRLGRKAGDIPLSVYIRDASLHAIVRQPVSKELMKEIRDLNNLGTNVNYLAKTARTYGFTSIATKAEEAADGICQVLHEARTKIKPKEEENSALLSN